MKGWSKAMIGGGGVGEWGKVGLAGSRISGSLQACFSPPERQSWSWAPAKGDPRVLPAAIKPGQPCQLLQLGTGTERCRGSVCKKGCKFQSKTQTRGKASLTGAWLQGL